MRTLTWRLASLSLAMTASLLLKASLPVRGCVAAAALGTRVSITGEEAVIVWNSKTQTEHFIRRANFESSAHDFGFLVPTPSPPHLAKADSTIFDVLAETYRPRPIRQPVYGLKLTPLMDYFNSSNIPATGGFTESPLASVVRSQAVSVLDVEQVAGYNAVVLRADNVKALTTWLKSHGYAIRPTMAAWLHPYVARHWAITAFKIAKADPNNAGLSSGTVRMSFATDRPFFPYSEPADQRNGRQAASPSRILRVYCLSDARMTGALDSTAVHWPGRARWAETLSGRPRRAVSTLAGVPKDQLPPSLWLTAFEDRSSPRPGVADLYFSPSTQQMPLVPTVIVPDDRRLGVPVELLVAGLLFGTVQLRRRYANQNVARRNAVRTQFTDTLPERGFEENRCEKRQQ